MGVYYACNNSNKYTASRRAFEGPQVQSNRRKKSVNQIIREAIEMSLAATPQPEEREMDPFEDIIGIARSGIKDASSKHDRYLYGAKR